MGEAMDVQAASPAGTAQATGAKPLAELDMRSVPMANRLDAILSAWKKLPIGGTLKLVNDREPKPLSVMFRVTEPGRHAWTCEREGTDHWVALITRTGTKG